MGDRRKKKPYSKEDLETAFKAVKNGISIREACRIYGVPRTTLGDRLAERHGTVNGRQPELTADEEKRIVAMAQLLSIWGFPFTSVDLCHFVKNYLDRRGTVTRFKDNLPTHRSRGLYISLKTISPSPLINFPFFFLLSFKFPPLFAFPNSDFFTKYHQPIFYPLLPPPSQSYFTGMVPLYDTIPTGLWRGFSAATRSSASGPPTTSRGQGQASPERRWTPSSSIIPRR
jgi:hypothetical protein